MFDDIVGKYSYLYDVPASWIQSVILKESSGNPNVVTREPKVNSASYGLMGLLPSTAAALGYTGAPAGLLDPDTNIALGTQLIAQIRARFGDNPAVMYSVYNSGSPTAYQSPGAVADHVKQFLTILNSMPGEFSAGLVVVVALGLWLWLRRK